VTEHIFPHSFAQNSSKTKSICTTEHYVVTFSYLYVSCTIFSELYSIFHFNNIPQTTPQEP